jgi:hypothetical protein
MVFVMIPTTTSDKGEGGGGGGRAGRHDCGRGWGRQRLGGRGPYVQAAEAPQVSPYSVLKGGTGALAAIPSGRFCRVGYHGKDDLV